MSMYRCCRALCCIAESIPRAAGAQPWTDSSGQDPQELRGILLQKGGGTASAIFRALLGGTAPWLTVNVDNNEQNDGT